MIINTRTSCNKTSQIKSTQETKTIGKTCNSTNTLHSYLYTYTYELMLYKLTYIYAKLLLKSYKGNNQAEKNSNYLCYQYFKRIIWLGLKKTWLSSYTYHSRKQKKNVHVSMHSHKHVNIWLNFLPSRIISTVCL